MKKSILLALMAFFPGTLLAQEPPTFAVNHFDPLPILKTNLLNVAGSGVLDHLTPSAGLLFHYSREPLILARDADDAPLIEYQAMGEIWVGIGLFDYVDLGIMLPVTFLQEGGDLDAAADNKDATLATVGDIRATAKFRLLKPSQAWGFGAAALATVYFPIGDETSFNSDGEVRVEPRVVLDWTHPVGVGVFTNVAYQVRPERTQFGYKSDDKIRYGAGLMVPTGAEGLRIYTTIFGDLQADKPEWGSGAGEPAEAQGGLQWQSKQGITLTIGAGPGLNSGVGTPKWRVITAFGFSTPDDDQDDDGIKDRVDACPLEPEDIDGDRDTDGCPDDDRDGDRIPDDRDACPDVREDYDGYQDDDGCPEPDNDGDGVLDDLDRCPIVAGKGTKDGCPRLDSDGDGIFDDVDRCPEVPEDKDGFDDEDGCPDEDNDFDGIPDKDDRCPFKAEDKDGYQDEDGCPDDDNDGDGIMDVADKCPNDAETMNGIDDEDGCPDAKESSVKITKDRLIITEKVYFGNASDRIESRSFGILDDIARTLQENPQIRRMIVEGHTDSRGNEDKNQALSERRAASVMKYLVQKGVDSSRLEARGYGPDKPIADNDTSAGREKNRRVEFIIAK